MFRNIHILVFLNHLLLRFSDMVGRLGEGKEGRGLKSGRKERERVVEEMERT